MSSQEPEKPQQPQRNKRRLWPWAVGVVFTVIGEWRGLVSAQAQLTPDAILVVDFEAGTDGNCVNDPAQSRGLYARNSKMWSWRGRDIIRAGRVSPGERSANVEPSGLS